MRVLLVIAEMDVGGAQRVVIELARAHRQRGDEVALAAGSGLLDRELEGVGVDRYVIPARGRSPHRVASGAIRLARTIRAFRPDLVHSQNVKVTGMAALARAAARRRDAPLLATFQGVTPAEERSAARVLRTADEVVCVSAELADRLAAAGFPAGRLSVVHNAAPVPDPPAPALRAARRRELGLDGSSVVAIVGRLVPQKAHERFLEAMTVVGRRHPDARFLVVGDGPLRGRIESRVRALGLGDRVVLTGARSDARTLIASSDLLVFSSDWEGLSLAALEALAAGVPVVSTEVAGMRELLAPGAGLVVAREADAIAAAVSDLLDDPDRRVAMGRTGAELAAGRFSLEAMLHGYREVYARLMGGSRPPSDRSRVLRRRHRESV